MKSGEGIFAVVRGRTRSVILAASLALCGGAVAEPTNTPTPLPTATSTGVPPTPTPRPRTQAEVDQEIIDQSFPSPDGPIRTPISAEQARALRGILQNRVEQSEAAAQADPNNPALAAQAARFRTQLRRLNAASPLPPAPTQVTPPGPGGQPTPVPVRTATPRPQNRQNNNRDREPQRQRQREREPQEELQRQQPQAPQAPPAVEKAPLPQLPPGESSGGPPAPSGAPPAANVAPPPAPQVAKAEIATPPAKGEEVKVAGLTVGSAANAAVPTVTRPGDPPTKAGYSAAAKNALLIFTAEGKPQVRNSRLQGLPTVAGNAVARGPVTAGRRTPAALASRSGTVSAAAANRLSSSIRGPGPRRAPTGSAVVARATPQRTGYAFVAPAKMSRSIASGSFSGAQKNGQFRAFTARNTKGKKKSPANGPAKPTGDTAAPAPGAPDEDEDEASNGGHRGQ